MIDKPEKCADMGTYEHTVPMCVRRNKVIHCDLCVAPLVAALEAGGFEPAGSCCGHGEMPASVLLQDRRMVIIMTEEEASMFFAMIKNNDFTGENKND